MNFLFHPFSTIVSTHPYLAYLALFLAVFWEGEFALITAGVLLHMGVFSLWPTVMVAICAATAKTIVGYHIGRFLGKTFPKSHLLKYFSRKVFYYLPSYKKRPFWSIFISKFIYGVNNAALIFAGYTKTNFKTYCTAEAISSVIWLGGMFVLGNYFSSTAQALSHNVRYFTFILLLFIVGFIILLRTLKLVIEIVEELATGEVEE